MVDHLNIYHEEHSKVAIYVKKSNNNSSYSMLDIESLFMILAIIISIINLLIRQYYDLDRDDNDIEFDHRMRQRNKKINQIVLPHHIRNMVLENEKVCAICWDPLVHIDIITKCGHMFHEKCIFKIVSNQCPKCRSALDS